MNHMETVKRIRQGEAKSDIIGAIHNSELYDLLGMDIHSTQGEKKSWEAFTETLGRVAGDVPANKRNDVEDRAQDFGNEREETGFRNGFHVAMRLCMEGLGGGAGI